MPLGGYLPGEMKKSIAMFVGIVCGTGLIALSSNAQEAEHTLSEFKLGEHVSGEKVKLADLGGKVVVIEYWGTR